MATKKSAAPTVAAKSVLVTTEYRGVFFGYLQGDLPDGVPQSLTLKDARNCIIWSNAEHGVFGLAAQGPSSQCRIGPKIPSLTLYKLTSVSECTSEAAEKWEAGPWIA